MSPRRMVTRALAAATAALALAATPTAAQATPDRPDPSRSVASPATRVVAAPLPGAHSHNDYLRARPLQEALDHGFTSVEADVWLVGGRLCLGHAAPDCSRDLEGTYLKPLQARADANGGSVHPGWSGTFQLLVELKSDGATTWPVLERLLAAYPRLMTHWQDGRRVSAPVQAVVTGNRPKSLMLSANPRWSACDGSIGDIGSFDPELMPMVSGSWWDEFSWRGGAPMPADQRARLEDIVARAHAAGHTVRFYATPELNDPVSAWRRRTVWDAERAAGVDWLNTDNPAVLEDYLR